MQRGYTTDTTSMHWACTSGSTRWAEIIAHHPNPMHGCQDITPSNVHKFNHYGQIHTGVYIIRVSHRSIVIVLFTAEYIVDDF